MAEQTDCPWPVPVETDPLKRIVLADKFDALVEAVAGTLGTLDGLSAEMARNGMHWTAKHLIEDRDRLAAALKGLE